MREKTLRAICGVFLDDDDDDDEQHTSTENVLGPRSDAELAFSRTETRPDNRKYRMRQDIWGLSDARRVGCERGVPLMLKGVSNEGSRCRRSCFSVFAGRRICTPNRCR